MWRTVKLTGPQMLAEWLKKYEGIVPESAQCDLYDIAKQSDYQFKLEPLSKWMT